MEGQDQHHGMSFASISGKPVEATFYGGILTSDSGVMLLREPVIGCRFPAGTWPVNPR